MTSHEPQLWTALRDRLDPKYTLVRGSTPEECPTIWASLLPWPWVVVGDCSTLPLETLELLNASPVIVHWLGAIPEGLRAQPWGDWRELCNNLKRLLASGQGDLRLAPIRGINTPAGRLDRVEVLENLLAAYPQSLPALNISTERTTRINRLLVSLDLPWKVTRRHGQLYLKNHHQEVV